MSVFNELKKRGLIKQTTNEDLAKELLDREKTTFYIGFDCTADSLHVGHFVQMMIISHMQKAGHFPLILFGGGTTLIGDPSGKTDMRKMLTKEEIEYNMACFKKQMEKFVDFSENKAKIVNNADWLANLNYIDFLRNIGVHFSVNRMLSFECYKQRLERGLSFFELNYMLMQSYDFLYLNQKYNCQIEMGGDDQWSNIIGGVELIRKKLAKEACGITFALLTTSDGRKMGKTENGAVWLDPNKTTPYEFFQYWRNVDDKDVINCLKMLTFLSLEEIEQLANLQGSQINKAKEILALEVTTLVHGKDEAQKAQIAAQNLFGCGTNMQNIPEIFIAKEDFTDNKIFVLDLLVKTKIVPSKSEARRLIQQGGIFLKIKEQEEKIEDINQILEMSDFNNNEIILRKGKKIYNKISLK